MGAGLAKNRVLWCISERFLSLPSARSIRRFFSDIYFRNLVKLLEVKLTKVWVLFMSGSSWSFYLSDWSILSLQWFTNDSSGFPAPALVPIGVSAPGFLRFDSLYPLVGLSGQWFDLVSHFSCGSKKSFCFFSCLERASL